MTFNEMQYEPVDNANITPSEPAFTGSVSKDEPAPVVADVEEDAAVVEEVTETPAEAAPVEEAPQEEAPVGTPGYDGDKFKELLDAQKYTPQDVELDVLDEYGNFDPQKFAAFMKANNEQIFTQAKSSVLATTEAQRIEDDMWSGVHTDYPEIKENAAYETALRGARIQDMLAGGDGDLKRLAQEFVGPIRQSKIEAIENVNRSVKQQEDLQVAVPQASAQAPADVPLMTQLKQALAAGDGEAAQALRHAIRKERIYGKSEE